VLRPEGEEAVNANERIQRACDRYVIEKGRSPTHIFIGRHLYNEARRSIYARAEEQGMTLYYWNGYRLECLLSLPEEAVLVGDVLEVAE
jgi:hypothetical protein